MPGLVRPALRAILEAIDGIDASIKGKAFEQFVDDWLLRHGVQRGIEIISEAARRIPPALQETQPNIPWTQIMSIGNILRHEYHRVSDRVVWNVIRDHLEPLKAAVMTIDAALDEK